MKRCLLLAALALAAFLAVALHLLLAPIPVRAGEAGSRKKAQQLAEFNQRLGGRVVDYTHNHGQDNRRFSNVLCRWRDLYVYLPPGYCPDRAYPLILWLHGAFGDEHAFFNTGRLLYLDQQMRTGCFPPVIVACPDGTCRGRSSLWSDHSLYVNGCCGRFEDHIMQEVLPFLQSCYTIHPDRRNHVLAGVSAGGFGAMSLGLKHRAYFGSIVSLAGALNFRYTNTDGNWFADFHPSTYRWRTNYNPREVIGVFFGGAVRIRARKFIRPVFGDDPGLLPRIKTANPADLVSTLPLQPGELAIYLAYGGRDQLNLDAHGASFAWLARRRGIAVDVAYYPDGDHTSDFFRRSQIDAYHWIAQQLNRARDSSATGELRTGR